VQQEALASNIVLPAAGKRRYFVRRMINRAAPAKWDKEIEALLKKKAP
jgi:hypothetical protein